MTKRRPRKTNPWARKPKSRHEKEECPYCGEKLSVGSLGPHIAVTHPIHYKREDYEE